MCPPTHARIPETYRIRMIAGWSECKAALLSYVGSESAEGGNGRYETLVLLQSAWCMQIG